jgi:AcrR family transcriptional regulator
MDLIQLTYPNANSLNFSKKENITQKARCLFSKYGTQSVSMDDIANHCKISKKTIYAFWDSKEILVTEIVKLVLAENSETLDEIQADSYPFGEPLIAIWCDGYNFVAAVAVADLLECC